MELWDRPSIRWLAALLAAAVAVAIWLYVGSRPSERATPPVIQVSGTPLVSARAEPTTATTVTIDVVGPVRKPGLLVLPAGSRVADAIAAAGGLARGKTSLNLARVLVDGEQVDVRASAPTPLAPGSMPSQAGSSLGGINLNQASLEQLQELPRIGPVTAQKILDFRDAHGGFRSVDQLQEVSGIGDVTFAGLRDLVVV